MLMVIVQEVFLYLIIKSLLRDLYVVTLIDSVFLSACIVISYIGFSTLTIYFSVVMLVLFTIYSWFYERDFSKAISITLQAFILSTVADHLSNLLIQLWKLPNGYLVIFVCIQILIVFLINIILAKMNISTTFERKSLNIITSLLLIMLYLYIVFSEGWENPVKMILGNLVLLLIMIVLLLVIYSEYLKNIKTEYEVQKQRTQIQNDTRYMSEIEAHYNELRRFRHDYQNMLISIDEYLKTDDLKGLREYYQKNLAPVSHRVLKEKYNLEDLSRVKVKSIKSILFSKLSYAQSQEIEVHFDLKEPLTDITVNELDLDIALGIMLDNAIEASVGHADGEIMSAIFIEKNITVFLIQNNVFEQLPPLWKLKEAGYSTKGKNRGIGLNSLSKIVNRNENMILETRVLGAVFLQRLTVKRVSQND
ncbi:GHKL domain-containing protein [Lactiplantibacillus paraplantarum]|uniref:sensor histidine kinase n=1 Tax=Lactiplantibacillus paraplantarum TaxID=60520 RepID=UPI0021A26DBA|nr:GHKL domain-containing protein [Lactiplantibacillus paraplantarum]MCT4456718.1 GHKL domain-containing protein [Lactiplantibacillus paraplantarum]